MHGRATHPEEKREREETEKTRGRINERGIQREEDSEKQPGRSGWRTQQPTQFTLVTTEKKFAGGVLPKVQGVCAGGHKRVLVA